MLNVLGILNETRNKLTSNKDNHNYFALKIIFVLPFAIYIEAKILK